MTYTTLLVEKRDDAITLVTLNRPQQLNALNAQILDDLIAAFADYETDRAQRCLVLTGSPKAFAAGADIKEMTERSAASFYLDDVFAPWQSRIAATRKPWIAGVAGFALGGGCELAMIADYIIAADTAKFGQPEIKLSVAPGIGGSQRLGRAIGKAKAMEMCLTGRLMDASEAENAGLVARVVPADRLIEEALASAKVVASMGMMAAMMNKEMMSLAFETTLAQGMLAERRMFQILAASEDKVEGMDAFVAKRSPVWSHQ